jgi:hypothetical protein
MTQGLGASSGLAQATQALYAAAVDKGHEAQSIPDLIAILSEA